MRTSVLTIVAGLLLAACGQSQPAPETAAQPRAKAVHVAPVVIADASRSFALTGVTRAAQRAVIAFQASGTLKSRPVNIGDKVKAGDLIASLSNPDAQPQVASAKARLAELKSRVAQAERDAKRVQTLFDQSAATREELEQSSARRDALRASQDNAQAQLSRAQRNLGENRITAPVAGQIDQVFFQPGEFVLAGRPVASLSGAGALEVEIGVPENLLGAVTIGQTAKLHLPLFQDRKITGRVSELASGAGGPGKLFQAIITLNEDQNLRAGLTVVWALQSHQPQQLMVPVSAVSSPGGSATPRVYRVVDGKAFAVPVKLGEIVDESVIVRGDLAAGESIIVVGLNNLTNGRAVKVLP